MCRRRIGAARRKSRHHGRPLSPSPAASEVPARPHPGSPPGGRARQRGPRRSRRGIFLGEPDAPHVRLLLHRERGAERMTRLEGWPLDQARARCLEVDRTRGLFMRYFFGETALRSVQYDLVVNTGRVPLDDVVAMTSAIVRLGPAETSSGPAGRRVLTLSRELGAGETQFAAPWPSV